MMQVDPLGSGMKEPSPRKWKTSHLVIAALVALLVGVGIGAAGEEKGGVAAPVVTTTVSFSATTTATTLAVPATATRQWTVVTQLNGDDSTKGENFTLSGAQARITYSSDAALFTIYLAHPGQDLNRVGGLPVVTCGGDCRDTQRLDKAAGEYYLDVRGGGVWTVMIEELR